MVADREAAARAIAEAGKRTRTPLPGWLWISAAVVSAICVTALVLGWLLSDPSPQPAAHSPQPAALGSNGFTIGIVIGLACGIAIGSLMAVRSRQKRD
jgi:hypothetical protein